MAWIRIVDPAAATSLLARIYEAAVKRAGKVFQIIRIQSPRPQALRASTQLYLEVMHSKRSGLSRAQREMIATAVSQINGCHYWTVQHAKDLRAEVHERQGGEELVAAVAADYRTADLSPCDRAMLDYAAKLTRTPAEMVEADVEALRAAGFDDGQVHDIAQVAALFAYYNRMADGLGIDPEPE